MPFLFNIRFPCETAIIGPVRDLADRVAQYAGFKAREAGEIGAAVGTSAAAASSQVPAGSRDVEILFQTSDTNFDVTFVIDGQLSHALAGFTCAAEGSRTICRLTRRLPDAFTG